MEEIMKLTQLLDALPAVLFLLQAGAFGIGFLCGQVSWLLLLKSKDEKEFF